MAYFLQQLVNGITLGSIYGLIAIGYTMVYGIIGMINFAHGEIFMIGAFLSILGFALLGVTGVTWLPLALVMVLVLVMVFTSVYGWAVERIAYRPLRGSQRLAALISAIGMSLALQNYVLLTQGAGVKVLQPVMQGGFQLYSQANFTVIISYIQILILIVTVSLMLLFARLISNTALGRSQRACEQDRGMAALLGVDVDRTISLTFVMGALLAAVAGLMVTLYYGVIDFFMGFVAGLKAGYLLPANGGIFESVFGYSFRNSNDFNLLNNSFDIQAFHRLFAWVVFAITLIIFNKTRKTALAKAGTLVLGLTMAQIILGISTLLLSVQIHTAITHQFIAIILLLSVVRLTYLSSEKSQLGA